jgi:hypothetical protein
MSKTIRKQYPSSLNNLPLDDQRRILDWLASHSYRVVLEKIAAPRPDGFGLKIQYTSLRRFWHRHASAETDADRADKVSLNLLASKTDPAANAYPALTLEALERYCFKMAMDPHHNAENLLKFAKLILKIRQQELKPNLNTAFLPSPETFAPLSTSATPCLSTQNLAVEHGKISCPQLKTDRVSTA